MLLVTLVVATATLFATGKAFLELRMTLGGLDLFGELALCDFCAVLTFLVMLVFLVAFALLRFAAATFDDLEDFFGAP